MKYPAYNHKLTLRGNLIELLDANNTFNESQLFDLTAKQILKRDEVQSQISEITKMLTEADLMRRNVTSSVDVLIKSHAQMEGTINGLKHLVELPESAGLTELFNAVEALELNKPQLSEIRYVLHGDIQPCSVLYSDETTTLLRLDEGDMMLETDTIEWSDSVTYRCQELLKSAAVKLSVPVTLSPIKLFAQLVRDERILLNDNGDAAGYPKTVHIKVDNFSSESLAPGSIEQPCDECSHIFDAQSMTCPMCNTIRSSEWTDNNSPTPLR